MKRRDFLQTTALTVTALSATSAVKADVAKPKLQFDANGMFKIAQFTDTHYRTNAKDEEAVKLIAETLEAEKPQLAVFTGDIVTHDPDTQKGWDNILAPCIEAKVPFAVMLGNHDHEGATLPPRGIVDYVAKKPYSVTQVGPEDIFGASNYILEIFNGDKVARLIYCIDSNAYNNLNPKTRLTNYDWIRDSQINWFKQRSAEYTKQNDGKPLPALAFFHIPLNEYGEMIHFKTELKGAEIAALKKDKIIVGKRFELECPGALNSGMFAAMQEAGDVMGVFVGHDHIDDYVGLHNDIALGYGRWSGTKTTYGSKYMTHGSRLFELSKDGDKTFRTWIRQRGGETFFDIQVPNDLIASKEKQK